MFDVHVPRSSFGLTATTCQRGKCWATTSSYWCHSSL
ncbi:unnamed protein product [Callosobruchus maculatus]|uniref:Uncharacterized protein n=1 Tax=Callosobruchus maculatus TaxID=64391 RepID=A0A653D611_CALMS|nr:unnamed protein product [Callosobruchus maculatus]